MEYLTPADRDKLMQQLDELKSKRKSITDRIAEAREHGDLRENAEYHAAREDQGMNEAKIRQLEERLATAQVVDPNSMPDDVVFVGATVKLRETESGDEDLYKVVGDASGDFTLDYIEVTSSSPMGRALMHARVGDTVRVELPKGEKKFEILEIVV
ncbi:MAG: transcription elongation factor GreA [Phycisphaerales bacterium]